VGVELRGFEPLTSCMPSQLQCHTGPYGTSPGTTSHQVGRRVKDPAVLLCVGWHGPVADTVLTGAAGAYGRLAAVVDDRQPMSRG
jgi:hypothetical protein